ncbi:MAG: hypothetical protein AAFY65_01400 [Pseudomonadota bacterium]
MNQLAELAKNVTAILAVLGVLGGGAMWLLEPHIAAWLQDRVSAPVPIGGACTRIPRSGHFAGSGRSDDWVVLEWREVERLRDDCGQPDVTAIVANGDNVLHEADLSISGITLTKGTHDLKYLFRVPNETQPGPARIRVFVNFPNAVGGAPPVISPWVRFTILHDPPPNIQ